MQNDNFFPDTIAAVATGYGEAGIGIVRISGKDALKICDKIFKDKKQSRASGFNTYSLHYGWIVEGQADEAACAGNRIKTEAVIDEVILTVMKAPKSYTREDVVEINCHGGIVAMRRVLELVLKEGARLAEPGEFTKRAFLNGRIDLAQAEAILDIISAKTEAALKLGLEQLRGNFSEEINALRSKLIDTLSLLEANFDFPEEEIGSVDLASLRAELKSSDSKLKEIIDSSKQREIFREGIHAVICGKPNVGKSSLLNALLKKERSIVSHVAGTTRDTIEEIIDIKGIPVRIVDTAGILEPRDLVEKKAVWRSRRAMEEADLAILMFDASRPFSKEDSFLIKKLRDKKTIAILNKIDLKEKIDRKKILAKFHSLIEISAKRMLNLTLLENQITGLVYGGKIPFFESRIITNMRHISMLREAQKFIAQAINSLDNELSLELTAQDIKEGLACLDKILGKSFSEDLLDSIFSNFCIGK